MKTQAFIQFLQDELQLPPAAINLALNHSDGNSSFAMVLWQYGLVTLNQLDRIFDWQFEHPPEFPV